MGNALGDRVRVTQPDNSDYSDLIRTKRLFCGVTRAKPLPGRSSAINLSPLLRIGAYLCD
jgi:hypothetical protein